MANGRGKKVVFVLVLLSAILLVGVVLFCLFFPVKVYHYEETDKVLFNPFMGFSPSADNPDAVGENTLVYVDVTWKELEPSEGVYDFAGIWESNNLEQWKSEGKHVVFRFICDIPGKEEHMDIPDWLYEKTKDGVFYDGAYGKGYSPEYDNETFITYHEKAIAALGEEFGQDDFFAYVELGSLGHWGEWHVKYDEGMPRIPGEETCDRYIKPYLTAFQNAEIMMRRPFTYTKTYGLGVFNDMAGDPDDTSDWLDWIAKGGSYTEPKSPIGLSANPEIFKESPIGGEFTSGITMEEMLTTNLKQTTSLLQKSHMIFIGPKCPIQEEWDAYEDGVKEVLKNTGYRYGTRKVSIWKNKVAHTVRVDMALKNSGTAPMYQNWPLYFYQLDAKGEVVSKEPIGVDLGKIFGGESVKIQQKMVYTSTDEPLWLGVGIENPATETPEVEFDMDTERFGKIAVIGAINNAD